MALHTDTTPAASAPPETEDFAEYDAWRRAQHGNTETVNVHSKNASAVDQAQTSTRTAEDTDTSGSSRERDSGEAEQDYDEDGEPTGPEQEQEQEQEQTQAHPKRKGGFQRRIDKLVREKRELEARIAALEKRLAADTQSTPAGAQAGNTGTQATTEEPGKPRPEDFDTYEAYTEALTDWKIEQRERQRARQEAERIAYQSWIERIESARKAHPDFDEVVDSDVPISAAMHQAILESEYGAEIAYWLGKHPEEAERISKLPPLSAVREIGKIEASLARPEPKPKAQLTRAPRPVNPVTGGKPGAVADIYDPALAEDYNAWEAARRADLKRRLG